MNADLPHSDRISVASARWSTAGTNRAAIWSLSFVLAGTQGALVAFDPKLALLVVVLVAGGLGCWRLWRTAPFLGAVVFPVLLLGLIIPKSLTALLDVVLIVTAFAWLSGTEARGARFIASVGAVAMPFLWLVILLNPNVPDLSAGILGIQKATMIFIGLALGLLWPRQGREAVTALLPRLLLAAGIANLAIHLLAPGFEASFVRGAGVYTALFAGQARMQGVYSGPFHIALLGTFLILYGWQRLPVSRLANALTYMAVGGLLVFFSEVRSAYLVCVLGLILLTIYGSRMEGSRQVRRVALALCALVAIVGLATFASKVDPAAESITTLGHEQRAVTRVTKWSEAVSMFGRSPVYGWGPGSAASALDSEFAGREYVTSHDSVLTYLVEGGVIGISAFALIFVATGLAGRGWLRSGHPGTAAALALIGMGLTNNIEEAAPVALLLAVLIGLRANQRSAEESSLAKPETAGYGRAIAVVGG